MEVADGEKVHTCNLANRSIGAPNLLADVSGEFSEVIEIGAGLRRRASDGVGLISYHLAFSDKAIGSRTPANALATRFA